MANDPYKYFRIEARELLQGLSQGILELEKEGGSIHVIGRLLRCAHTLKGASRVVKQLEIAKLAHAMEDVLAPHRHTGGPILQEHFDQLLKMVDGIATEVSGLDTPLEPQPKNVSHAAVDDPLDTVRIEIGELDHLFEGISEVGVELNALRSDVEETERTRLLAKLVNEQLIKFRNTGSNGSGMMPARIQSLAEDLLASLGQLQRNLANHLDHASRELAQVRVEADRLRLVPASDLFVALERAVRDAAQSLKKRVDLRTFGGETRVNAHVLGEVRSALLHAVRNSVDHGIESESERRAAGKSPVGTVELSVERRGHRVAFICKDDGRGIDLEAVRLVAVRRGLISPTEAAVLSLDEAVQLILEQGVTTMEGVSELSGRGIGLDVVQEVARRLKGVVALQSEQGRGTTLEISVPISLSSLPALVAELEGVAVSLPLDAVRGTSRLADSEISRSAGRNTIVHEGRLVPFIPLGRLLSRESLRGQRHWSSVIIQAESDLMALGVDRLLGITDVVVRPLPSWVAADPIVAGTTLDNKGQPQLVLDPGAVIVAARAHTEGSVEPPLSRPPVLVIDDSLTTRMLEQSILKSAGYEVDLAVSGEDGLIKARDRAYGLFVVDVEMPGIDGFEFLKQTQLDPELRHIPAILVTSRNSAEDQLRGKELGAHAYIVKSEFDQGFLLKTLRDLIG